MEIVNPDRLPPQPGEVWQHFKGGRYKIECLAVRESSLAMEVVYSDRETTWVRPLAEFMEILGDEPTYYYRFSRYNKEMESKELRDAIAELFRYHAPKTEAEKANHQTINDAAADFAIAIAGVVKDPETLMAIFTSIASIREAANRAYTYQRIGKPKLIRETIEKVTNANNAKY